MAENLKLYFNEQLIRYKGLHSDALAELATINESLAQVIDNHGTLVADFAELQRNIAARRETMSDPGLMPADLQLLVDELRLLLIEQRQARCEILSEEDRIAVMQQSRDALSEWLEQLKTYLVGMTEDAIEADAQAETHTAWALKVSEGEISELMDQANAIVAIIDGATPDPEADAVLQAAETARNRIQSDIPEVLRNHALARVTYLDNQLGNRNSQLSTLQQQKVIQLAADNGKTGSVAQAWLGYDNAEQAYAEVVTHGNATLARAEASLTAVANSSELTQAEKDRISAVSLPAEHDALAKQLARDNAQADVAAKVIEIEDAITAALIADINADPEAAVVALRTDLNNLENALGIAESEFDAALQEALGLWQASIPDAIWSNFLKYQTAVDSLRTLTAADITALGNAFNDSETALVEALGAEEESLRLSDQLQQRAELLQSRLNDLGQSRSAHLLSAIRGDTGYHSSLVQGEIL